MTWHVFFPKPLPQNLLLNMLILAPREALVSTGWISRIAFQDMSDVWVGCPKNVFAGWGIAEERNCHTELEWASQKFSERLNLYRPQMLHTFFLAGNLSWEVDTYLIVFEVNDWKEKRSHCMAGTEGGKGNKMAWNFQVNIGPFRLHSAYYSNITKARAVADWFFERQVKSHFWIL